MQLELTKNEIEIVKRLRLLPPYGKIEVSPNREKGKDKFKVVVTESIMLE